MAAPAREAPPWSAAPATPAVSLPDRAPVIAGSAKAPPKAAAGAAQRAAGARFLAMPARPGMPRRCRAAETLRSPFSELTPIDWAGLVAKESTACAKPPPPPRLAAWRAMVSAPWAVDVPGPPPLTLPRLTSAPAAALVAETSRSTPAPKAGAEKAAGAETGRLADCVSGSTLAATSAAVTPAVSGSRTGPADVRR